MAATVVNAEGIGFGVEIECTLPRDLCPVVGGYHSGVQIPDLPPGWNAQRDGSIRHRGDRVGVEIVSPVLRGAEGLQQIKTVCDWLTARRATVNPSCGLHVHVDLDKTQQNTKAVLTVVANLEKGLYASTGTKSRERGSYCRPVSSCHAARSGQLSLVDRYRLVNLNTRYPTVEFRAFSGTLNFVKIVAYVRVAVGIVQRATAIKQLPPWTPRPVKTYKRGGPGSCELCRLMYWLGWYTNGAGGKTYGGVGYGVPGLPTPEQTKKTLVRLAKKYDTLP